MSSRLLRVDLHTIAYYNHIISSLFENQLKTRFNLPPVLYASFSQRLRLPSLQLEPTSILDALLSSVRAQAPKSGRFEITKVKYRRC